MKHSAHWAWTVLTTFTEENKTSRVKTAVAAAIARIIWCIGINTGNYYTIQKIINKSILKQIAVLIYAQNQINMIISAAKPIMWYKITLYKRTANDIPNIL